MATDGSSNPAKEEKARTRECESFSFLLLLRVDTGV